MRTTTLTTTSRVLGNCHLATAVVPTTFEWTPTTQGGGWVLQAPVVVPFGKTVPEAGEQEMAGVPL